MDYNFRQVSGSTKFLSYKEWEVNDFIVGEIQALKPNNKNPKVQDIIIKVLESGLTALPMDKGEIFTINGTTALQKGIESGAEEGDIIKVIYKGKEKVKTGQWAGTMANALEVFVAANPEAVQEAKDKAPTDSDSGLL